jgi:hypothetical protein
VTIKHYLRKTCFLAALGAARLIAQTSGGVPAAPASSGTYSIEAEILAYKSLATNSDTISDGVAGLLSSAHAPGGVVIVPSASTILPSFQLWRSNMLVVQTFIRQTNMVLSDSNGCPTQTPRVGELPSFDIYATAVQTGVGTIQSILSLFATNQGVTEFAGTIQDQALMTAVARRLLAKKFPVLIPDVLAPSTIALIKGDQFPFIVLFTRLVDVHGRLQNAYQCNQIAVTAATQLQQAEIARDKDYQKLIDPTVSTAALQQPILDDIRGQKAQIDFLRPKIGLSPGDLTTISDDERTITDQQRIIADLTPANAARRAPALTLLKTTETDISSRENPAITTAALKAAKAQSLLMGIEAYLAGLTGGAVNFTPPSSSTAAAPAAGAPAAGAPAAGAPAAGAPAAGAPAAGAPAAGAPAAGAPAAGAPAAPGGPTPSPSAAASSTPPIVTILQVDGLAGRMGFRVTEPDSTAIGKPGLAFDQIDAWRILWLKSMESGGAIITKTNIFGSHPYFGGGAVSGFALFTLEGDLLCSGNTAAYGGFVKAADFPKLVDAAIPGDKKGAHIVSPPTRMLDLGGACKVP